MPSQGHGLDEDRLTCDSYSEAVDYLYTSNTFTLSNSYQQVPTIDYLSYFMLPHRIARLRTLHIYWDLDSPPYHLLTPTPIRDDSESSPWHRSWRAIAKLTGLRDLHVMLTSVSDPNFFIHNPQHWKHFGLALLKTIPRIKAESFVITLPSDTCTTRVRMKSRQCVLRLPGSYRRP
ncbi:hypothetical protein J1614_008632 [Plenodomus biglobosus]|nr:hypothetical protein J1614_008632 [Plenodomus biglobosus]